MALVLVGKKGLLIAAIRTGLDGSLLPLPLIRLEVCDCEELLAMLVSALNNDGNSARTKRGVNDRAGDGDIKTGNSTGCVRNTHWQWLSVCVFLKWSRFKEHKGAV